MAKEEKDMTSLVKRGSVYWLRKRIPTELVPILGKKERCYSLRTRDRTTALKLHAMELVKLNAEFDALLRKHRVSAGMEITGESASSLSIHEIRCIVFTWFHEYETKVSQADSEMRRDSGKADLRDAIVDLQGDETVVRDELGAACDDVSQGKWAERETDELLRNHGLKLPPTSPEYEQIKHLVGRGLIESFTRRRSRLRGEPVPRTEDQYFASVHAEQPLPEVIKKAPEITVVELAERFISEQTAKGLRPKTLETYRVVAARFSEVVGKTAISKLGREEFVKFRDILRRAPANAKKRYPHLNLQQVAIFGEQNGIPPMSVRTVNKTFETLSALFKYAEEWSLVTKNNAQRLSLAEVGPEKERVFAIPQLRALFNAPLYTGCKDDAHGYADAGTAHPRRGRFWVPLISLYSGMRLNEICQLHLEDIKNEEGVEYFSIRALLDDGSTAPDKRLKTKNARRNVPIHPELKSIGFLQYVSAKRAAGEKRLFPDLELSSNGTYSDTFQKWFSRFLNQISAANFTGLSFHCFRHTFRHALREAQVATEIVNRLCGWKESDGMAGHYGQAPSLRLLQAEISKTNYPGLNLDHLLLAPV